MTTLEIVLSIAVALLVAFNVLFTIAAQKIHAEQEAKIAALQAKTRDRS